MCLNEGTGTMQEIKTQEIKTARCWREFCDNPAEYHINNGWGLCAHDHNVAYYWAGRPVYREQQCNTCKAGV
jgi:hypothetical protein